VAALPKIPKQAQLALMIVVPALVCGGIGWMTYKDLQILGEDPKLSPSFVRQKGDAKSLFAQIKKLDTEIQTNKGILQDKAKTEAEHKAALKVKQEAEDMLPKAAEKGELSQRIEELARLVPPTIGKVDLKSVVLVQGGAEARGRSPGPVGPQATTLKTELTGDLNSIIAFIDAVEKNPRFMQVNSASIRSGSVGTSDGGKIEYAAHTASLEIVTYIYAPPERPAGD
jgi:hypothetical protein